MTLELSGSLESNTRNLVKVAKLVTKTFKNHKSLSFLRQIRFASLKSLHRFAVKYIISMHFLIRVSFSHEASSFRFEAMICWFWVSCHLPWSEFKVSNSKFYLQARVPGFPWLPPWMVGWMGRTGLVGCIWMSCCVVFQSFAEISVEIFSVSCSRFWTCDTWRGYNANSFLAVGTWYFFCHFVSLFFRL